MLESRTSAKMPPANQALWFHADLSLGRPADRPDRP